MNKRPFILFFILLIIQNCYSETDDSEAQKIYLVAKKNTIDQNWDSAVQMFNKVIHEYPECKYVDESQFWIGYCYEKKPGFLKQAFEAYALVGLSSQSAWSDDARLRRVFIAETLIQEDEKYKKYLLKQLTSSNIQIKQLAAIALARTGDTRALPVLRDIPEEEDLYNEARQFIRELEKKPKSGEIDKIERNTSSDMSLTQTTPFSDLELGPDGKKINYFAEKSLQQYQSLVRTDDNWSDNELIDFGLWHTLRTDLFDTYMQMKGESKQRFLRRLWLTNDPTPTTDVNEAKIEFERRVYYSREHFSYFDNLEGHFYAPWDARGEIYIKYGEPHSKSVKNYDEIWYYPQYDYLQFYIRTKVTNIFGRAIFLQRYMSSRLRGTPQNKKAVYDVVYTPKFVYHYDYGKKMIKNFRAFVEQTDNKIILKYEMPAKEFKIMKDSRFYIDYMLNYAVYNKDYYKIISNTQQKRISELSKDDLKKKLISESIELNLTPGEYFIGLTVEGDNSNNIAIYKKNINGENYLEQ
ncbi:GWxTD domain-containing protein [candidate division KSB1 bacterium]|nr:GWxTD domain-containing protein [candidate division KSB1 bacterium]